MDRILLYAPIPGMEELKGDLEPVVLNHPSRDEVIERLKGCVGFIPLLSFKVDRQIIDAGEELKVIANYAVGYDNIDVSYATEKRIYILNTPDVLTRATAELTWALIFATGRRLIEGDLMVREERFTGWQPDLLLGLELKGSTLGIVGAGRIGSEVAKIGIGLGLKVIYYDKKQRPGLERMNIRYSPLEDLLRTADIVSLHLPLTPETRQMIDQKRLSRLKEGAILINTGRGPLVDETALIKILRQGRIRAGLDVYEQEPSVPEGLRELDNVVLLPHIGSATKRARFGMAKLCFDGIRKVLQGEIPSNCLNP
ncbi:MAG TPA: D-glycerate dehydrogenase [bacterium (Candidatus Stahlbacteria)]|nr:D-glycerate dehydrogenase [Candidatus Stahlbacteria bacterium]